MGLRTKGGIHGGLHKLRIQPGVRLRESSVRELSKLDAHQKVPIN